MSERDADRIARIEESLKRRPLGEVIEQVLGEATPAELQQQIDSLEQTIGTAREPRIREHLEAARSELLAARRNATLAAQQDLSRAISRIARAGGMALGKEAAPKARPTGKRRSAAELREILLAVLPADPASGLPGKVLAREAGVSYQTARTRLLELADSGAIVRHGAGPGTTWHRKT